MKLASFFIAFTLLLAFTVCASAQKSKAKNFKISGKEKTAILKQVFDNGFEKLIEDERFTQCTIPIINDEKIILIQTTEPKIYPKSIGEYRFKFMTYEEIKAEINYPAAS